MIATGPRADRKRREPAQLRGGAVAHDANLPDRVPERSRRSWPAGRRGFRAPGSWPLVMLAVPATVAVWSGWVQLGRMTGFGLVRPLPGLWDSLRINTAITLPVGVEAYGAFALGTWLASGTQTSHRTRRYAMWSAIGSLLLGMAGQVAYHLMTQARLTRAPWAITTVVACLPVLLLGMAAALAHMRHADASCQHAETAGHRSRAQVPLAGHDRREDALGWGLPERGGPCPHGAAPPDEAVAEDTDCVESERLEMARLTALQLTSTGLRISRRNLREAGVRGSNADLGALVRAVSAKLACDDHCAPAAPDDQVRATRAATPAFNGGPDD